MKSERQKVLLDTLNTVEFSSVTKLASILKVSEMTVRRDINELAEEKLLVKEHGGARRLNSILSTNDKMYRNTKEKEYIGKIMSQLIDDNDVIFIGAGTTIYYALQSIKLSYKSIITNSIVSFNYLMENGFPNIFLTGGELFEQTGEFYGEHAEALLEQFNIDKAFLATNGIYEENVTTSKPALGRLQNKVIDNAKKSFLIADHSKFNFSDTYTFITLDKLDGIITDKYISNETLENYKKLIKIYN